MKRFLVFLMIFVLVFSLYCREMLAESPAAVWQMFHHDPQHTGRSSYDTSSNNGMLKWKFKTDSWVCSSPAIEYDGTIYFGSYDSYFYALNPDGTLKWKYQTGQIYTSSPAIGSDGTIYVGSYDTNLYALNPDGTLKWKYQTGRKIYSSSPNIALDGTIYVGSEDNYLYAVNPDGTLKWKYKTGSWIYSSPAIASDGTIYVGSGDHYLYALHPSGTLKWRYQTDNTIVSSPTIASDGTIYVGGLDNYFYALNPDGTLKWRYQTGHWVSPSPAISSDGTIYVGSYDNYFYAFNTDGTLKWRYSTGGKAYSPSISKDGTIYFGSGDRNFYALNPDGSLRWSYKTGSWVESSPAIGSDGTIYVGSGDGYLYAIGSFTITTSSSSGGSISPSGTVAVSLGDSKTFTINPETGYIIKDVKVDGVSVGKVSTHTFSSINSNHTIEATFEKQVTQTVIILKIGNTTFTVNGSTRTLDSPPIIKNSRTLLPIRAVVESLGGTVGWDANTKKVTVSLGSTTLELWIGKSIAKVNGVDTPIDPDNSKVVPEIINSRTMLPLRFVTESLGCDVQWDGTTKTITIEYQQ